MVENHAAAIGSEVWQEVLGYLNFSSGTPDPKFLRGLNLLFDQVEAAGTPSGELARWVAGIDGPENHVRAAVELVRRLTAGLRMDPVRRHLFLNIALREGQAAA